MFRECMLDHVLVVQFLGDAKILYCVIHCVSYVLIYFYCNDA